MKKYCLLVILCIVSVMSISARPAYRMRSEMIKMRDGVRLYTSIIEPIDSVPVPGGHPILMTRTCYGSPVGDKLPAWVERDTANLYLKAGYIIVNQDVRGKNMSEGTFVEMRPFIENKKKKQTDEASDTYDTVEWLIHNTNSNGCVGVYGISYPGFYSTKAALCGHPALKAVSPQAPVTDWWRGDDVHHNGAFAIADMFAFQGWFEYGMVAKAHTDTTYMRNLKLPSMPAKDLYSAYKEVGPFRNFTKLTGDSIRGWNDLIEHQGLDAWWEATNPTAGHCHDVKPAIMVVGGLFDAEDCYGAFQTYRAIRDQSPQTHLLLVDGPWAHGSWSRGQTEWFGDIYFGNEITSKWYNENIEYPFFAYYLEGKGEEPGTGVKIFDTGSLKWNDYTHEEWKSLQTAKTTEIAIVAEGKKATYVSDPEHPVPFTFKPAARRSTTYMLEDQRLASARPDVYTMQGDVLTEPMTINGPVDVELNVVLNDLNGNKSDSLDADFVVKIIDLFPDDFRYDIPGNNASARPSRDQRGATMAGYQMLVRWEIMRGRYRNTTGAIFDNQKQCFVDKDSNLQDVSPVGFKPGEATKVKFMLNDVQHTFLPGHRMMIQVQSSMFPLFDINPQKYCDIYTCGEEDFQPVSVTLLPGSKIEICKN